MSIPLALTSFDKQSWALIAGAAGVLILASVVGAVLRLKARSDASTRFAVNFDARTRAWWAMVAVFTLALWLGIQAVCALFGVLSFLALREMLTLAPTRRSDHHTLFWSFFVIVPLQYYLVAIGWLGLFFVFIPVYAFVFLAIRSTLTGDYAHYAERTAKIFWAVMICVYFLSHAAALLTLDIPGYRDSWKLLAYLVIVTEMSDVSQYVWGKLLGRHRIAPNLSPNKTWEGFIGGGLSSCAIGTVLYAITPFDPLHAAGMSFAIVVLGFFGGIVMSAVKRDAGIKDFGHLIPGHGGILDRIDSLSFAAPVFFHLVRWWYT